ncbi:MAG: TetR/AcrR family transcriptional regulator [Parasphingopyxis sp.]|uniref:TetR/AcrR family transcriptional regulator n=1 Tax=Parasphingopyxis sp. TaxID=1920299 RepID=UPI002639ED5C|nr:TetR/AcrR family transcriptional regulator [uncultured Parasphingopyxis sp.]
MARPQTDHDEMREQLLDCAEQIIRERGPVAPTVTEIAAKCGMSQSNVYRFFPNKDALFEASVERWFAPFNDIMDEVVESDLEPREKLFQFFARRAALKAARYEEDPDYFQSCMTLGEEYSDVVMGYIDLADHYMAIILGEAISAGYFAGMTIDQLVSPVNLMLQPYCDPELTMRYPTATEKNLRIIVDTIFDGLRGDREVQKSEPLRLAS